MTGHPVDRFRDDDRGSALLQLPIGPETLGTTFIGAVLGFPVIAALGGTLLRRTEAARYLLTGAAALLALFTLTGLPRFRTPWTVVGILAVLVAIVGHLWQHRDDRFDLLVLSNIYLPPLLLALLLLGQTLL